jgi:hypothetical protein
LDNVLLKEPSVANGTTIPSASTLLLLLLLPLL